MGKTEASEEPQQLSLEEEKKEKTRLKREEEKHQKPETKIWVMVIFMLTIVVSIFFYFVSGNKVSSQPSGANTKVRPAQTTRPVQQEGGWGSRVYEF